MYLCIDHCKSNGHGQVDPCFQEGNGLCSTSWCCHHKHILYMAEQISLQTKMSRIHEFGSKTYLKKPQLTWKVCTSSGQPRHGASTLSGYLRVTQNGVVEENAKEHEAQGDDLLPCECFDSHEFLCGGSSVVGCRCHNC